MRYLRVILVLVACSLPKAEAEVQPARELALDLGGGVKIEMVLVPAGEFDMGSNDGPENEKPVHKVKISKPFYIGKYEVTVAQFRRFVEATKYETECERGGNKGWTALESTWRETTGINWKSPGYKQEDNHPVVLVSWNDTQAFVAWASKLTNRDVRLPSEAQWEYAARGPESRKFPWGDKWDGTLANHCDAALKKTGFALWECTADNDGFAYTAPVGSFKNASWCGAFDMVGNVWEWVNDKHQDDYFAKSPAVDPPGGEGPKHGLRGGSWGTILSAFRPTTRDNNVPDFRYMGLGFRIAVTAEVKAP